MSTPSQPGRCEWATGDPLNLEYHDREWGVPLHDDRALFELLCLEGAQAGLSWTTILHKREGYRRAFAGFDPARLATLGERDVERLLGDPGIVRNRAKVRSVIANAGAYLRLTNEIGPFSDHLWSYVDGRPVQNRWEAMGTIPAKTDVSRALSRDLKRRGFSFVGPTIMYAFMQSVGMVNDHVVSCFRHSEVGGMT
jgi:DNA-3-methyladenine glycosylase I